MPPRLKKPPPVVAAGARAYPHGPGHVAVLVVVTSFGFWLAHVYSHSLGESLGRDRRLSVEEVTYIARREASMLEAALPPVVALFLGAIGLLSDKTALWAAFGAGLAVLAAQAVVFSRTERLGPLATLAVVAVNLSLGLVLVALKLFVSH